VAFAGETAILLRPGGIGVAELSRALGQPLREADAAAPRASGTLASHYAPRTPASLVAADVLRAEILQFDERDEIVAVLARTVARPTDFAGAWLQAPATATLTRSARGRGRCLRISWASVASRNRRESQSAMAGWAAKMRDSGCGDRAMSEV